MKAFTSLDWQQRTGDIQKAAGLEPVVILSHNKPRNVVMSAEEFERLKAKAGEPVQVIAPRVQSRTVRAPKDPLGYDISDFGAAVDRMIDDVRSGRTAAAVASELAAIRRRYRGSVSA
ncbi:MAG: type II toxin-antitoxin system Phd/YefM family antitoxin [Azospirillum sp.]|nr:type II toxin-antitoxin system Phd/YefM family antitoxin [Azospirillum sp.]